MKRRDFLKLGLILPLGLLLKKQPVKDFSFIADAQKILNERQVSQSDRVIWDHETNRCYPRNVVWKPVVEHKLIKGWVI